MKESRIPGNQIRSVKNQHIGRNFENQNNSSIEKKTVLDTQGCLVESCRSNFYDFTRKVGRLLPLRKENMNKYENIKKDETLTPQFRKIKKPSGSVTSETKEQKSGLETRKSERFHQKPVCRLVLAFTCMNRQNKTGFLRFRQTKTRRKKVHTYIYIYLVQEINKSGIKNQKSEIKESERFRPPSLSQKKRCLPLGADLNGPGQTSGFNFSVHKRKKLAEKYTETRKTKHLPLSVLQSRLGDKLLGIGVVRPQNGT